MDHLTELYCLMDDFCKEFEPALKANGCQHLHREFPRLPSYQRWSSRDM